MIDTDASEERHPLFPPIEPFVSGFLNVSPRHELYWEEAGASNGRPILFLHGGPGAGASSVHRRFFDPRTWRVIIHDQRGAGRSKPLAETSENTTDDLIADIERLRVARGIESWVLFGGSWGSTLALAYAEAHPDRCLGLVLRGVFLGTTAEIHWIVKGLRNLSPQAWEDFATFIPVAERDDLIAAYCRRLADPCQNIQSAAAVHWARYEALNSTLAPNPALVGEMCEERAALALARIELHYFAHDNFLFPDQLVENLPRITHLPAIIVQGRYDLLCPPLAAYCLAQAWPRSEFILVNDAGHSAFEPGITRELIAAAKRMSTAAIEF